MPHIEYVLLFLSSRRLVLVCILYNDDDDDDDDDDKGSRDMGEVAPLHGADSTLVLTNPGVQ
jgi:hypothetical protein